MAVLYRWRVKLWVWVAVEGVLDPPLAVLVAGRKKGDGKRRGREEEAEEEKGWDAMRCISMGRGRSRSD